MKSRPLSDTSWKPSALPWWKLRRREAGAIGQGTYGSPDFRLWLLALSRVGPWGHACFDRGELRTLLAKVNRTSGEVSTYSERALRGLIRELSNADLLAPVSNTRCLVLPIEIVDSHLAMGRVTCPEHRCRHVWSNRIDDWVDVRRDGSIDLERYSLRVRQRDAA